MNNYYRLLTQLTSTVGSTRIVGISPNPSMAPPVICAVDIGYFTCRSISGLIPGFTISIPKSRDWTMIPGLQSLYGRRHNWFPKWPVTAPKRPAWRSIWPSWFGKELWIFLKMFHDVIGKIQFEKQKHLDIARPPYWILLAGIDCIGRM